MFRSSLKVSAIVLAALAVVIQFFGPAPTNPAVDPARELRTIEQFDRSCADCHSSRTRWPWYSHVAPASWFVVGHVDHARSHMNVSEWAGLTPPDADHKLATICKFSRNGKMPLDSYLLLHRDARLSAVDADAICKWTEALRLAGARPKDQAPLE